MGGQSSVEEEGHPIFRNKFFCNVIFLLFLIPESLLLGKLIQLLGMGDQYPLMRWKETSQVMPRGNPWMRHKRLCCGQVWYYCPGELG